jgi:hypothetical protein
MQPHDLTQQNAELQQQCIALEALNARLVLTHQTELRQTQGELQTTTRLAQTPSVRAEI